MHTQTTMPLPTLPAIAYPLAAKRNDETIGTRVWIDEYSFLLSLYYSSANGSPKFRLPDLISACVSLVFLESDPAQRIFIYLHTELILRDPDSARRQEEIWTPQYKLLLGLQRSPANRHPNPQFKLDHFTTACIALVRVGQAPHSRIFEQARRNTADRAAGKEPITQLHQ